MKKILLLIVLFLMAFTTQATITKPQNDSLITSESTIYNYQTSYVNLCLYNTNTNTTYGCEMYYNRSYITLDDNNNKSSDAIYTLTINCPTNSDFNGSYKLKFYEITTDGVYYTVVGLNDGYYGSFLFGTGGITFLLVTPKESYLAFYGI